MRDTQVRELIIFCEFAKRYNNSAQMYVRWCVRSYNTIGTVTAGTSLVVEPGRLGSTAKRQWYPFALPIPATPKTSAESRCDAEMRTRHLDAFPIIHYR